MSKRWPIFVLVVGVAILAYGIARNPSPNAPGINANNASKQPDTPPEPQFYSVIAQNLRVPWEVAFLVNGDLILTERVGTLRRVGKSVNVIAVPGARQFGEGGLLGMALHPDFKNNNFMYLYFTTRNRGRNINRVMRFTFANNSLREGKIIIDNIPAAANHDGGRIAFGPDGYLYVTAGDANQPSLAQNTKSLAGKILRVKDDGTLPDDNPFHNAVYSYGHRNPEGIAWDNSGRLWETEHGRSGVQSGLDEINIIEKGGNYGWPVIQGDQKKAGMITPVANSGPKVTWAPSGIAVIGQRIYFSGLRGEAVYTADITGNTVGPIVAHLQGKYGRLRAARVGPDGRLYVSTSNKDGRGKPNPGDDKIIALSPDYILTQ